MYYKLKHIDEFKEWIVNVSPTKRGWKATFYPNKIVETLSFQRMVEELLLHVMNETIGLSMDALQIKDKSILKLSRKNKGGNKNPILQELSDSKLAIANVVFNRFSNKLSQVTMESALGWKHGMLFHATKNSDVKQIKDKINKIYKIYPFLENGYKDMKR